MNKTEAILLYLFTVVSKQVNKNITLVHMKQSIQKMYKDYSKLFPMPICDYSQSKQKLMIRWCPESSTFEYHISISSDGVKTYK